MIGLGLEHGGQVDGTGSLLDGFRMPSRDVGDGQIRSTATLGQGIWLGRRPRRPPTVDRRRVGGSRRDGSFQGVVFLRIRMLHLIAFTGIIEQ